MYVEEKNFCGEEEELDLGSFVLVFKDHNFLESLSEAKRRFKNLLFRVNVSLWNAKGRL